MEMKRSIVPSVGEMLKARHSVPIMPQVHRNGHRGIPQTLETGTAERSHRLGGRLGSPLPISESCPRLGGAPHALLICIIQYATTVSRTASADAKSPMPSANARCSNGCAPRSDARTKLGNLWSLPILNGVSSNR